MLKYQILRRMIESLRWMWTRWVKIILIMLKFIEYLYNNLISNYIISQSNNFPFRLKSWWNYGICASFFRILYFFCIFKLCGGFKLDLPLVIYMKWQAGGSNVKLIFAILVYALLNELDSKLFKFLFGCFQFQTSKWSMPIQIECFIHY